MMMMMMIVNIIPCRNKCIITLVAFVEKNILKASQLKGEGSKEGEPAVLVFDIRY